MTAMPLVVFLRGVNVGGHRTFRPTSLASDLSDYGVINIGAAGTFIVRKPGDPEKFRAALRKKLPFQAHIIVCNGADLLRLATSNPFGPDPPPPDIVRFVSVLPQAGNLLKPLPVSFPAEAEWLVRVIAAHGQFAFGLYRRHMKTITYLGQVDKLFDLPVTTRNWNTILAVTQILAGKAAPPAGSARRR